MAWPGTIEPVGTTGGLFVFLAPGGRLHERTARNAASVRAVYRGKGDRDAMTNSTLKGHGTIAEAAAIITGIAKHPRSDPPPPASGVERRGDEAIRAAVAAEREATAVMVEKKWGPLVERTDEIAADIRARS
jgi:hypothetical protein